MKTPDGLRSLRVGLGDRAYPIHVGPGVLSRADLLADCLPGGDVLLVTNETVAPLYLETARATLAGRRVETLVLPDGEAYKTLESFGRVLDALASGRFHRDCCVAALGGGVIGDLAGFAAASYQRGVALLQLPTTLLAQVDSSVGGKTAVNHPVGKNLIGAFHQPVAVLADTDTLATLPAREYAAGLAEVIKYGLILDADFLAWLERHMPALLARAPGPVAEAIARSCDLKARVVAEDEREHGRRALLNLGHTFGHAIEALAGYGEWLHGEAVAVGMVMAAETSHRLGWIAAADLARVRSLVSAAGLPVAAPDFAPEAMLTAMGMDKKVIGGRLRLVLLRTLGDAVVSADVPRELLLGVLSDVRRAS
ncbi:MAG: 3-dehydroquinate synthase [Gammaproteobacteria bacterium]|nr:3-dehydroquinate synthase [Gammaproteobacteria bacterium]